MRTVILDHALVITSSVCTYVTMERYPCRLCGQNHISKNMVSLFSTAGIRHKLPARITKLIQVPVDDRDRLPTCICQECKHRVVALEKAVQGLTEFESNANVHTKTVLSSVPLSLKQTKESSSDVGISPDIARCRPRSKKPSKAVKSLSFDSGKSITNVWTGETLDGKRESFVECD